MGEHDAMLFGTPKTTTGKEKTVDGKAQARRKLTCCAYTRTNAGSWLQRSVTLLSGIARPRVESGSS